VHFLLDTADVEAIHAACAVFPIAGVTTNPTNVARETAPLRDLVAAIRGILGPDRSLHVQVVAPDADGMLAEARLLAELVGPGFCCKVPVTRDGLAAVGRIVAAGMTATATSVSSVGQALLAARAGAAYLIPYVNRMDVAEGPGAGAALVAEIVSTFRLYKIETRLIAASVKTVEQGHACARAGAWAVTLPVDVLEATLRHPLTDAAVEGFARDWEAVYEALAVDAPRRR
jgi:TalC/MipB family fructose-6-phosphate aldolase